MKAYVSNLIAGFKKELTDFYFIQYIIQCILGSSFCYLLYILFPDHQFNWSIISVLLVLAPEHTHSVKLSLNRMIANIIGALIGLATIIAQPLNLFTLAIGITATIMTCTFIKLGNASRSALAALVIVLTQEHGTSSTPAYERMLCVITGCVTAMAITYAFNFFHTLFSSKPDRSSD